MRPPVIEIEKPLVRPPANSNTEGTPISKSQSKRLEIEQLRKQIEQLQKSVQISPVVNKKTPEAEPKTESSPARKQESGVSKIQQYELIKSRYTVANNVNRTFMADDSFQCISELPDTPTLPEPMTFLKTECKEPNPNVDISRFM